MEQINCTAVLVHMLELGKNRFSYRSYVFMLFKLREATVCRKHGRQCHLNDILQVIIGGVQYAG
jgi:hypothetical protein